MKVWNVSFNFPVKKTINITYGQAVRIIDGKESVSFDRDTDLKVIVSVTEEQKKSLDEATLMVALHSDKSIKSVKIVYDVQRNFAVRSKDIIEAETTEAKLKEYLKVNGIEVTDSLLEKSKEIEDMQSIRYFNPHHTFTLLSLKLVGAIGIYKKSGLNEITIDFTKYDQGLIALCGENGRGKTTVIENCHPYPQMLTRSGKLQSHFFMKDSLRELTYIDEEGTYYVITINIDGATKSGKCRYFVKSGKSLDELKGIADLDGNVDPYTSWVNENFGPISLFLRTAFFAKETTGNIPDISRATKGEKKELFSTLIGVDYLSNLQETARLQIKNLNKELDVASAQLDDKDYSEIRKELGLKLLDNEQSVTFKRAQSEKIRADIDEFKAKIKDIPDTYTAEERKRIVSNRISELKDVLEIISSTDEENVDMQLSDLSELSKLQNQWQEYIDNTYEPCSERHSEIMSKIKGIDNDIQILNIKASALKSGLADIDETCPTCGQKLPAEKIDELNRKNDEIKNCIEVNEKKIAELLKLRNDLENEDAELDFMSVSETEKKMHKDVSELKRRCSNHQNTESLNELKRLFKSHTVEGVTEELDILDKELKELEKSNKNNRSELSDKLNVLTENLKEIESSIEELLVSNGKTRQMIESAREQEEINSKCKSRITELNHEISEYKILDDAFGANGIQALELEAFAPDVADVTNRILESAYGDRFKVSFQTLRQGVDGHLIEDFSIMIEDTSNGMVTPLEWLSSGESVWIKEALYNAFSIIRMRSTRFNFRTRFLDEADGSLDSEARMKYLKMIRAAHDEGDVYQTILITHSQEVKDIVENKIEL